MNQPSTWEEAFAVQIARIEAQLYQTRSNAPKVKTYDKWLAITKLVQHLYSENWTPQDIIAWIAELEFKDKNKLINALKNCDYTQMLN